MTRFISAIVTIRGHTGIAMSDMQITGAAGVSEAFMVEGMCTVHPTIPEVVGVLGVRRIHHGISIDGEPEGMTILAIVVQESPPMAVETTAAPQTAPVV